MQSRKLGINETVIIRNLNTLIDGAKTRNGRQYLQHTLDRLIEDASELICLEISKISPRKFQLDFITTEQNSYNMEDNNIFFTADWYDINRLNNVYTATYFNDLLGECEELRSILEGNN